MVRGDTGRGAKSMTSLMTEAAGIFSNSVSFFACQKGQSSPEDITRSVFAPVGLLLAGDASEHGLADVVLLGGVPVGNASIGGLSGVHANHLPPRFIRFDRRDVDKGHPARVAGTSVEPGLRFLPVEQEPAGGIGVGTGLDSSGHVLDVEVLDHHEVVVGHQVASPLVVEVPPLAGDLAMQARLQPPARPGLRRIARRARRAARAPLLGGQTLLRDLQSTLAHPLPAGAAGSLSGRHPAEEAAERLVERPRRGQLGGEQPQSDIWPDGPDLLQPCRLAAVELNRRTTSAGGSDSWTRMKTCRWSSITSLATMPQQLSPAISLESPSRRRAARPQSKRSPSFGYHAKCSRSEPAPPAERRKRGSTMSPQLPQLPQLPHLPQLPQLPHLYELGATLTGKVGPACRAPMPLGAEAARGIGAS